MYRLGPCIPIFREVFLIKSAKRMCICEYVKIVLVLIKNALLGLKKGISRLLRWVAAKPSAI